METELSRPVSDEDDNMQLFDDEDNEEPGNPMDEAVEVPAPNESNEDGTEAKTIKPKRVIKNPQPKLDAVRLMGPRGIGILQSTFKDMKFRGKGYEKEDLRLLMKKLEHWAHRLFPKFPFDDTLKQLEKLGSKKPVQNMVKRIRLDMFQSDELNNENKENDETSKDDQTPEVDVFDQLLSTGPFAKESSQTVPYQVEDANSTFSSSQPLTPMSLTEEQRERIAQKRLEALERRRKRLQEQETEKEISMSQSSQNNISFPNDEATMNLASKDTTENEISMSENAENRISFPTDDATMNLASKDTTENEISMSENAENRISFPTDDATMNLANKEATENEISMSENAENRISFPTDDATMNLANKETTEKEIYMSQNAENRISLPTDDATMNLASKEATEKEISTSKNIESGISFPTDDVTTNLGSRESSSEGKDKMEEISVENGTENSHMKEQNTLVSSKSTQNDDSNGSVSESKKVNPDEESNDVEMVTEDDLLGLIN